MTLRATATTDLASRLATVYGTRVAIGRLRSNEAEATGNHAILIPGGETAESDAPLSPVRINFSISVYENRIESALPEHEIIDAIISTTRAAIESDEPEAFEIIYTGAEPMYSDSGGNLVGAELRYTTQNFIG